MGHNTASQPSPTAVGLTSPEQHPNTGGQRASNLNRVATSPGRSCSNGEHGNRQNNPSHNVHGATDARANNTATDVAEQSTARGTTTRPAATRTRWRRSHRHRNQATARSTTPPDADGATDDPTGHEPNNTSAQAANSVPDATSNTPQAIHDDMTQTHTTENQARATAVEADPDQPPWDQPARRCRAAGGETSTKRRARQPACSKQGHEIRLQATQQAGTPNAGHRRSNRKAPAGESYMCPRSHTPTMTREHQQTQYTPR